MNVFEEVRDVIVENLAVEAEEVQPSSLILEDLGADSLDIVEITMAIEERFGVSIPDEKLEKVRSVEDIVKHLEEAL